MAASPDDLDPLALSTLRRMYGVEPLSASEQLAQTTAKRLAAMDALSAGQRVDPAALQSIDNQYTTLSDEFMNGLRRFAYSTKATTQAFAGQMAEPLSPEFAKSQFAAAKQTMDSMPQSLRPAVDDFSKVNDFRTFGQWAAGGLGEGLPSTALMLGAGIAGRGAALLARASPAVRAAAQYGAGIGTMVPLEGGESAMELQNSPQALANTTPAERTALTLGRGTINAVGENVVPQMLIAPRLLGRAARIKPGFGNAARNAGLIAGEGALGEYGTEFAQDLTGQAVMNYAVPGTGYDLAKANEAGLKGALVGAFTGGLGSAAQGVYSNFGAMKDAVADKLPNMPKMPKSPTIDDAVGRFFQIVDNPRQFGIDVGNTTLGAMEQLAKAGGKAGDVAAEGMDKAGDLVGGLKQRIDRYILDNISPDKQQRYIDATADLSSMTHTQWEALKEGLRSDGKVPLADAITSFGRATGKEAVEKAPKVWDWVSEASKGLYDTVKKGASGEKQSFVIREFGADERSGLLKDISKLSPELGSALQKGSINERRRLADVLLSAYNNQSIFENAEQSQAKKRLLEGWQRDTGTDLRQVLQAVRERQNTIAASKPGADREPGENAWDRFASVETEIKRGEVDLSLKEDGGAKQELGGSPFNVDALRQSMVQERFKNNPTTGIEVTLSSKDLTPSQIAQLVGKRVGRDQYAGYGKNEVSDDQPLKIKVNPMSLAAMTKMPEFRDAFAGELDEYNERAGVGRQAAQRFSSGLGTLLDRGIEVPLKDGSVAKIEVSADLSNLPKGLVLQRGKGQDPYTLADFEGAKARKGWAAQLGRLNRFEGNLDNAISTLRKETDNPASQQLIKVLNARAKQNNRSVGDELKAYYNELRIRQRTREQDNNLRYEREALREALMNEDLTRKDLEPLLEYYRNGWGKGEAFTAARKVQRLLRSMYNIELSKLEKNDPRRAQQADLIEEVIAEVEASDAKSEGILTGNEQIGGATRNGAPSFTKKKTDPREEEFVTAKLTPLERANTSVLSRAVADAARSGKPITPYTKPTTPDQNTILKTIAEAKTVLRLQQIGARIKQIADQLTNVALDNIRKAYAAKLSELKNPNAAAESKAPAPATSKKETESAPTDASMRSSSAALGPAKQTLVNASESPATAPATGVVGENREGQPVNPRDLGGRRERQSLDNPDSTEPTPEAKAAREKFIAVVEKMVGKRIKVVFDQDLGPDVAATYKDRPTLDEVRNKRRDWLFEKTKNTADRESGLSDAEIDKRIASLERLEKKLLADTAIRGLIRVATGRENQAGLAEHETIHGAFSFFFTPQERSALGLAFSQGLVGKRLREYFKDQPQILSVIDPKSASFDPEEAAAYGFQVWSLDPNALKLGERATSLFGRFKEFIRNLLGILTPEEKAALIFNDLKSGRRAEQGVSPLAKQLDKDAPWQDRAQDFVRDIGGLLEKGYDYFLTSMNERIIKLENPQLTRIAKLAYEATGDEGQGGMIQKMRQQTRLFENRADKVFQGLTDEELLALHEAKIFNKPPTDPKLLQKYKEFNRLFDELYEYQKSAGILMNKVGIDGTYYPLTWDPEKVLKNRDAFVAMLEKYPQLKDAQKTPSEIWTGIVSYLERGEDLVNVMGKNGEPISEHAKTRTLGFISREDRRPFMTDDAKQNTVRYIKQAVRQAEYVRAFGMNGEKLAEMKNEARTTYGATADDTALVDDLIDGLLGNKEIGMSRELKDLYGAMTVYQNVRLLPFALFNSLIDPLGIAVRSNSIGDAWSTFSYSMKNLFRELKSSYTPDQWEMLAEDWGIIERAGTTLSAHNLYDGVTLRGTTKKINDAFFKYNLLNGWIRNNTIMAVASAQRFMYRAAEGKFGEETSKRYLDELALSKDDVIYSEEKGRILMRKEELMEAGKSEQEAAAIEEKLRIATDKFVRQALINPSAAELPGWASNPYLAPIAHLKTFVWGFNATITDRIYHELSHGNYKPAMLAAAYVPGMIGATFLKDMVNGFGDEPPYKKDWGVTDYVQEGVSKSGLTGTGQFFTSAKEDILRGGIGIEYALGPSFGQGRKFIQALGSEKEGAMWDWMVKSMPANPVYDNFLLSN